MLLNHTHARTHAHAIDRQDVKVIKKRRDGQEAKGELSKVVI